MQDNRSKDKKPEENFWKNMYRQNEQCSNQKIKHTIERKGLRWFGHMARMIKDRKHKHILEAKADGKNGKITQETPWEEKKKSARNKENGIRYG